MLKKSLEFAAALCGILFILSVTGCSKPGDYTVQNGVTAYGSGKYEEALELFKQALETETRYSDEMIYNLISSVYAAQEDYENSAVWLEKSLESKPDYRGFVTLGMNYQNLKKFDKAEESYGKAIDLDQNKGEAWASRGMLFVENENYTKAVEDLKKGTELAPKIAVIHAYYAVALFKNGQKDDAAAEFEKAEELYCDNLDMIKEKYGIDF